MNEARCDVTCVDHAGASRAMAAAEMLDTAGAARIARAAGDPSRLRLLAAIVAQSDLCACDLAWVADRPKNLVSHHLRQLREAGLVSSRRDGRFVRFSPTPMGVGVISVLAQLSPAGAVA